jgi:hypothetical protein
MTGEQVRWGWKTWRWTRKTGRTGLWHGVTTVPSMGSAARMQDRQSGIQSDHSGRRADPQTDDQSRR